MASYAELLGGASSSGGKSYADLLGEQGDVQTLNTPGMVQTIPAHVPGGPGSGNALVPEHQEPLLPPRKPYRRTLADRLGDAAARIGQAFMEPFQTDQTVFGGTQADLDRMTAQPLTSVSGLLLNASDKGIKLVDAMTSAIFQTAAEPIAAASGRDPRETGEALETYATVAGAAPELLRSNLKVPRGTRPYQAPSILKGSDEHFTALAEEAEKAGDAASAAALRRQAVDAPSNMEMHQDLAARAAAQPPPNPIGTAYSFDDVVNGKLRADLELDRQARASLNLLTPDKANYDDVVSNYKFWLDQIDPGHVLYPSTDGAVGEGIIGFRTQSGTDFAATGRGTRPSPGTAAPSDLTVYVPTAKAAALKKAQQVQASRGNTSGLHWDNQTGKLYFSVIGKDGKVIGEPRTVQTAAAPQIGRVPVEIRTDAAGTQTAQMADEITQIHQNMLPSTREQMIQSFKDRAAASKPNQTYPNTGIPGAVEQARKASAEQVAASEAFSLKKAYRVFKAAVVDRSGNIRSALLKQAGPAGKDAENKFMLSAGAPGRASKRFNEAYDTIYGGLVQGRIPAEDKEFVDQIIDSRRSAQILTYDPNYTSPFGKTPADFVQNLRDIRNQVGNAKYLELNARADVYFDTMKEQVGRLYDNGLISPEEYQKLVRFEYSPREYIDILDPAETMRLGKSTMSVRSSGVQALGSGSDLPLQMNSDTLLAQTVARVEGRIMRNEANKALARVADQPANGIVSLSKEDKSLGANPVAVSYMEGGQKRTVWMNKDLGKEWLNVQPEWANSLGRSLAKWSGANLVRSFATGINPVAGPFLFLMDAQSAIWLSHMYSGFVPKAMGQLARDIWTVLPDAVTRSGRYNRYAEEGGLMPFLVHGGRGTGLRSGPFAERDWNALASGLAYWNETFEVTMRLAIRERGLRNGLSAEQAAAEARRWIDFSQGGHVSKFADNVVPYLNAGIQGLRQLPREIKASPGKAAARATQFTVGVGGLYLYNWMRYPYVMEQVPDEEQARYFIFPTDQYAVDASGQKRYMYYKVPVTQNLRWLKGTIDAGLDLAFRGKARPREYWQSMKDSFGTFGDPAQLALPVVKAAQEYASNYDFYNQENIWKGQDNIPPSQEFLDLPDTPTSELAVDIGHITGLSPERMTKAFHDVIPRGLYTDAVDWAYRFAKEGDALPPDASQVTGPDAPTYIARQYPFLSRLIGVTHPMSNLYQDVKDIAQPQQGADYALTRQADTMSMRYLNAEGQEKRLAMQNFKNFVEQAPDFARQRLTERFKNTVIVDTAYQKFGAEADMPPKNFWLVMTNLSAKSRAEVFYEQWNGRSGESKRSMIGMAKKIPGFWSSDFGVLFNRIRQERGTSPEE